MTKNSQNSSISAKQAAAILAILRAPSIEKGCKAVKITRQTFYNWLENPAFAAEFTRVRRLLIAEGLETLKAAVGRATSTLVGLLDAEQATLQRAAANDILNHVQKQRETEDIEDRLTRLEQMAEDRR